MVYEESTFKKSYGSESIGSVTISLVLNSSDSSSFYPINFWRYVRIFKSIDLIGVSGWNEYRLVQMVVLWVLFWLWLSGNVMNSSTFVISHG